MGFGGISIWQLLIILVIVLLLFGGCRQWKPLLLINLANHTTNGIFRIVFRYCQYTKLWKAV